MNNVNLRKKLRPLIEAIVTPLVEEAIARAEAAVRERLEAALAPPPVKPAPKLVVQKRKRRGSRTKVDTGKSPNAARASGRSAGSETPKPQMVAPPSKPKRGPYKCKSCGAVGFRADGCGKTHNVAGSPMRDAITRTKAAAPAPAKLSPQQQAILDRARARERSTNGAAG